MAYCTQADLEKMLPQREMAQLTAESGDVPDSAIITEAIAKAQAEIDPYLGKRYVLPLAVTPAQIKNLAVDMAIYHLYSRRGIDEPVRRNKYRDAVGFLKDLAAGRAEITGLDGAELPGDAGDVTEISSSDRIFNRDNLSGF